MVPVPPVSFAGAGASLPDAASARIAIVAAIRAHAATANDRDFMMGASLPPQRSAWAGELTRVETRFCPVALGRRRSVHVQASLAKQIERQDADGEPSGAIVDNTVEIPGDLRDRVRDVLAASPPLRNIEKSAPGQTNRDAHIDVKFCGYG